MLTQWFYRIVLAFTLAATLAAPSVLPTYADCQLNGLAGGCPDQSVVATE